MKNHKIVALLPASIVLLCGILTQSHSAAAETTLKTAKGVAEVTTIAPGAPVTVEISGLAAQTLFQQFTEAGYQAAPCGEWSVVKNRNIACYLLDGKQKYRCIFDLNLENSVVTFRDMCIRPSIIGVMN